MTLYSMTGYGKAHGEAEGLAWTVELKSVNGRGLEIRNRIPSLFEGLEGPMRECLSKHLQRGNVSVSISLTPGQDATSLIINEAVLEHYAQVISQIKSKHGLAPSSAADLLALRGVAEFAATDLDAAAHERLQNAVLSSVEQAAQALNVTRAQEGARLHEVLSALIDKIDNCIEQAKARAQTQPEQLRQRLMDNLAKLADGEALPDAERIAQEVALLSIKADVQEEIDRLSGHVTAARDLLSSKAAVGRAFDFLAQEFFREANTLCSKSVDGALTRLGLDLKTLIEQVREQVRNLE